MYKRSFNIKHLPPVTLEVLEKHSIREYTTNNVTIIEVNQKYYLIKDVDDILKINENFFQFLIADTISIEDKIIYILPLSTKRNIIIEKMDNNIKASIYFKTAEEASKFELPNFLVEELEAENLNVFDDENKYTTISSDEIIFLVANLKDLETDENTIKELFKLYYKVKDSNNKKMNKKIQIKADSKILPLLQSAKIKIKKR